MMADLTTTNFIDFKLDRDILNVYGGETNYSIWCQSKLRPYSQNEYVFELEWMLSGPVENLFVEVVSFSKKYKPYLH
jgi:hypothetical protein